MLDRTNFDSRQECRHIRRLNARPFPLDLPNSIVEQGCRDKVFQVVAA
jgi:hypothetical protein